MQKSLIAPNHLALALDMADLSVAKNLVRELSGIFGVFKIGLTLWASEGPNAVQTLKSKEHKIFLDLKLHDIPHQVGKATLALSKLEVDYLTMHSSGGRAMLEAGIQGLADSSTKALAITVLTSHSDFDPMVFEERVILAKQAGCHGIVCSTLEISTVKSLVPDMFCVVPGIRASQNSGDDQARPGTPKEALANGADLLVIGRPITETSTPVLAAQSLLSL